MIDSHIKTANSADVFQAGSFLISYDESNKKWGHVLLFVLIAVFEQSSKLLRYIEETLQPGFVIGPFATLTNHHFRPVEKG